MLSTAAVVATAGAALAGGVAAPVMEPVIAPVVVAAAPVGAWQGGYAGANLSWGKVGIDGYDDLDGAGIALRGGYDWQNGNTVFGLGADYDFGKQKADFVGGEQALKNAGTVFARLGYDANGWLPYASLGYTWAKMEGPVVNENVDGYTIGLGVERKFTPNWAGYAEISHTDFGNIDALGVDADMQKIKLGVNYRF
ncbi:outer membrane protein [Falsigemmobacter intermedius]|uniref:outer membrane protein n=1 Tax=Falsigemmobacter intermedius TaxID=1553448 RepID=UPI001F50276C|nr:porin family protein [Falsigemmobacter intermedius]